MSKAEKNKFSNLLVRIVRKLAYAENKIYFKNNPYTYGSVVKSGSITKVPITVDFEGIEEAVIFYMKKVAGRWKVDDIELLDSSVIIDYKNQFNSIINKEGLNGLLKRMEKRLKALN
jgi:ABC-type transporter MlaC component